MLCNEAGGGRLGLWLQCLSARPLHARTIPRRAVGAGACRSDCFCSRDCRVVRHCLPAERPPVLARSHARRSRRDARRQVGARSALVRARPVVLGGMVTEVRGAPGTPWMPVGAAAAASIPMHLPCPGHLFCAFGSTSGTLRPETGAQPGSYYIQYSPGASTMRYSDHHPYSPVWELHPGTCQRLRGQRFSLATLPSALLSKCGFHRRPKPRPCWTQLGYWGDR